MSDKSFIYALKCPDTNNVMYVGQTTDVKKRKNQHCSAGDKSNKGLWVKSLLTQGKKPIFEIIEECDISEVNERETYHISENRKLNDLFNVLDGGRGKIKMHEDKLQRFYISIPKKYLDANGGEGICRRIAELHLINEARTKLKE
jgi:group I intron endonuclease